MPDARPTPSPARPLRRRIRIVTAGIAVATAAAVVSTAAASARPEAAHAHGSPAMAPMAMSAMSMAPGSIMVMPQFRTPSVVPAAQAAALAATIDPASASASAATTSAAAASVHHITLELLATDGASPDFTRAQALAGVALLRDFYRRETNGAIALVVDAVYDWQSVDISCSDWDSTFKYAKQRVNWVPAARQHLMIMLPSTVDCGYGGIAGQGATVDSGEALITVGTALGYTAHEFGHNVSLYHAGSLTCSTGSDGRWSNGTWSNGCRTEEYGDNYDLMGAAAYNFDLDAASLARLGALPNVYQVPATGSARVRIAPISAAYSARRAATYVDRRGTRYWIEVRSTSGNAVFAPHPAAGDPAYPNGVRVIRSDPNASPRGLTLSRPGDTSAAAQNFRLGDVVTLDDGTRITVLALDSTGATVRVVRAG